MTDSRSKTFACLRFIVQLLANQIIKFFCDFVSIVTQIDSEGWFAQVSLLLHLYFEVTRLDILVTCAARLSFETNIALTFELVNFLLF